MLETLTIPTTRPRSIVDRCLALTADVRAGEGARALLLALDVFCLLASYYLLKTVRESLLLGEHTAEVKSYAAAAQALMLLAIVPAYAAVASRVSRSRLVNGVLLFFASHIVLFYLLVTRGVSIAVPFFLWVGVFNLVIVAQFWAFANDLYSVDAGERLFPVIGIGGSIGAWAGARVASLLMGARVPTEELLLISAGGLMVCIGLNAMVARRPESHDPASASTDHGDRPLGPAGAFHLIARDSYLRWIALLVIVVNVVNTTGEYLLGRLVVADAAQAIASGAAAGLTKGQLIGVFYGNFFGWVNLAGLAIQLFVVSRVFRRIGVGGALFVLPVIASCSYGLFALAPVLATVRIGKVLENGTDYSLQNTTRHALFLRTSAEAKFKAKQAIDGLCWRLGDVLQAGIVFVGTQLAFGVREFALLNEGMVIVWLLVAAQIYREHRRQETAAHRELAAAA
jgi:ATP:ADP antiporter, AAA family